jgi:hypothetical protein
MTNPYPPPGGTQQTFDRASGFSAGSIGMVATTGDPATMSGSPNVTTGRPYLHRAYVDVSIQSGHMACDVLQLTGTNPTVSNAFMGVYDATTQQLLAQTGDISAALQAATAGAIVNAALTSPLPALPVNYEIYLAFLATLGGTSPALGLVGGRQFGTNQNMTADARLYTNQNGATLSALPAQLPALTITAGFSMLWLGVGP